MNRPIISLNAPEAGACGTCMLTGTAMGTYGDLREAVQYFVKEKEIFNPAPETAEKYEQKYRNYRKLYGAVQSFMVTYE